MATLSFSRSFKSAAQTQAFAKKLAKVLPGGTVLGLCGGLGAGKTTFVQGLARGLDVCEPREVCSPTYALSHSYPAKRFTLVHLDFYRLADARAAQDLGLLEQLWQTDCIIAIEWADRFITLCPPHTIWLRLSLVDGGERTCEVSGLADPWPPSPA